MWSGVGICSCSSRDDIYLCDVTLFARSFRSSTMTCICVKIEKRILFQ